MAELADVLEQVDGPPAHVVEMLRHLVLLARGHRRHVHVHELQELVVLAGHLVQVVLELHVLGSGLQGRLVGRLGLFAVLRSGLLEEPGCYGGGCLEDLLGALRDLVEDLRVVLHVEVGLLVEGCELLLLIVVDGFGDARMDRVYRDQGPVGVRVDEVFADELELAVLELRVLAAQLKTVQMGDQLISLSVAERLEDVVLRVFIEDVG
mmetsp:Transcript_42159/g.48929  ORF Transcript_42159/g.48929 Transcript_42159/m.48929 type:complete len:208 (-) Transcript_42159:2684-3307(-)